MFKFWFALYLSNFSLADSNFNPNELLKESDRPRGGVEKGLTWQLELTTEEQSQSSKRHFFIKTKGVNAIIEATAPPKFKGEVMLFKDRSMWFIKSSLRKPVAISSRQKLGGQAANGDIASTQYFRDYTPTFIKKEMIGNDEVVVLLLKANLETVTYDSIRYWISIKQKLALKAEFLNLQGNAFKEATFEYNNKVLIEGKSFPFISKMVITNSKNRNEKSILEYFNPKAAVFSESLFNVNNLGR